MTFFATQTLITVILSSFTLLAFLGLFVALLLTRKKKSTSSTTDFNAIAGDDVLTTQLDLARAYLEMDKVEAAKKILENVIQSGSKDQMKLARELLQMSNVTC